MNERWLGFIFGVPPLLAEAWGELAVARDGTETRNGEAGGERGRLLEI